MKTILKTTTFILFGCVAMNVVLAQQYISPDNLIIGQWKLKSSWVKRSGKIEYMPCTFHGDYTIKCTQMRGTFHGDYTIKCTRMRTFYETFFGLV